MSWYRVISDFVVNESSDSQQLTVRNGDYVNVLNKENSCDWWWVESSSGCHGYVPVNHLCNEPLTHDEMWDNDEYFSSYGDVKIHREMLNDSARNEGYLKAVTKAKDFITGMTVLDVGSGTGILSLMCAKYGNAKKVYAVERSDIAEVSKEIIKDNGQEDIIEVIQSDVADVELPNKVDMMISEWMGTLLLFEFMLESVIIARNKFLKPNGIVWPSQATLYLVPCNAEAKHKEYITVWKDVCGFNFTSLSSVFDVSSRPLHNHELSSHDILSCDVGNIFTINTSTVTLEDIEQFRTDVSFRINKNGTLHGFCSWFDVSFDGFPSPYTPHTLSTSPHAPLTHWKQDLLLLDNPLQLVEGDTITGSFEMHRHQFYRRHMRLLMIFSVTRNDTIIHKDIQQEYRIWR